MIRVISAGVLGLCVAAAGVANAQVDPDDVAMERKVPSLATIIGSAYSCTLQKGRDEFKEETHHLFDLILQDVGSDLAFTYATTLQQVRSGIDAGGCLR